MISLEKKVVSLTPDKELVGSKESKPRRAYTEYAPAGTPHASTRNLTLGVVTMRTGRCMPALRQRTQAKAA
jgi:hypothetical protein